MKRNDVIQLRVSPEEKARIERAAKDQGVAVSEFLRAAATVADYHGIGELENGGPRVGDPNPLDQLTEYEHQEIAKRRPTAGTMKLKRPTACPKHPDAGKMKSHGKTYCDYGGCQFVYS